MFPVSYCCPGLHRCPLASLPHSASDTPTHRHPLHPSWALVALLCGHSLMWKPVSRVLKRKPSTLSFCCVQATTWALASLFALVCLQCGVGGRLAQPHWCARPFQFSACGSPAVSLTPESLCFLHPRAGTERSPLEE